MKGWLGSFCVALCGLATSILVAIANVAIAQVFEFNLFTFSMWVVVPVGAMVTGFAAASGYYFGSLYFHKRPNRILFVQMVIIAGLTQCLIYWLGYTTMVLDDGRKLAALISFRDFMDIRLTRAHYQFGQSGLDTGEVGSMGYWIAGAQFVGFLLGGAWLFAVLKDKPTCTACHLYLRSLARKKKTFADASAASAYYDNLFALPLDSADFAERIRSDPRAKIRQGTLQVHTALLGCPDCKGQLVHETVQGFNGKEWKNMDGLARNVRIPAGVDLAPVFRSR